MILVMEIIPDIEANIQIESNNLVFQTKERQHQIEMCTDLECLNNNNYKDSLYIHRNLLFYPKIRNNSG